jgi:hypothetical protein
MSSASLCALVSVNRAGIGRSPRSSLSLSFNHLTGLVFHP